MAKAVLEDATIWFGRHDLSSYSNSAMIDISRDTPECTNFGSGGWREYAAGLLTGSANIQGFFRADVPSNSTSYDLDLFQGMASAPVVVTKTNPVAEGDLGYALRGNRTTWRFAGALGELAQMNLQVAEDARVIRPTCIGMESSVSASGNGSGLNLGAVSATQKLYGIVMIGGYTGAPTLDVIIETDATDAWVGAETTRITFTQETSATARYQWSTAAGAITDTWVRTSWTYGGSGSFSNLRVFVAIA